MSNQRKSRRPFKPALFPCSVKGCKTKCKKESGLLLHHQAVHQVPVDLSFWTSHSGPASQNEEENTVQDQLQAPSPSHSSRRSPRRTPSGSPLPRQRNVRALSDKQAGLKIEEHPILDGEIYFIEQSSNAQINI